MAALAVNTLQLRISRIPGDIRLVPFVVKNLGMPEICFDSFCDSSHEFALFARERKSHQKFLRYISGPRGVTHLRLAPVLRDLQPPPLPRARVGGGEFGSEFAAVLAIAKCVGQGKPVPFLRNELDDLIEHRNAELGKFPTSRTVTRKISRVRGKMACPLSSAVFSSPCSGAKSAWLLWSPTRHKVPTRQRGPGFAARTAPREIRGRS